MNITVGPDRTPGSIGEAQQSLKSIESRTAAVLSRYVAARTEFIAAARELRNRRDQHDRWSAHLAALGGTPLPSVGSGKPPAPTPVTRADFADPAG